MVSKIAKLESKLEKLSIARMKGGRYRDPLIFRIRDKIAELKQKGTEKMARKIPAFKIAPVRKGGGIKNLGVVMKRGAKKRGGAKRGGGGGGQ